MRWGHPGHALSLPDHGGVELARVEEDTVEGRGQTTFAKDGQGCPERPEICGDSRESRQCPPLVCLTREEPKHRNLG